MKTPVLLDNGLGIKQRGQGDIQSSQTETVKAEQNAGRQEGNAFTGPAALRFCSLRWTFARRSRQGFLLAFLDFISS